MRIHFFGTGSAVPTRERFRSSLLLETSSGDILLPDCGEVLSTGIARGGFPPDSVAGAVVSHMHPDHVAGLPLLLQLFQLRGRRKPFRILMPEEGIAATRDFLAAVYLGKELLEFEVDFAPIPREGKPAGIGPFVITFSANAHLRFQAEAMRRAGRRSYKGESYSMLISAGEKRIIYSGDLSEASEVRALFAPGIDAMVLEYAHITPEAARLLAAEPEIPRQVILTHFHPRWPAEMSPPVPGWICARDGMQCNV